MNTGQMMLTAMAMVLLGITTISMNRNSLNSGTIVRQTEIGIYGVSLATSYIERAATLQFDRYDTSTGTIITLLSQLTPINSLGYETGHGEKANDPTHWDDFDDYNNMCIQDTMPGVGIFLTRASVYYVNDLNANPGSLPTTPTWYKRMDVFTSGNLGRGVFTDTGSTATQMGVDTIKLSYIFSYFSM
jgi:energy-converting hydrogenase Eha subunit C